MTDDKFPLSDERIRDIEGGALDPGGVEWMRYTDTGIPVECPKCGRRDNIWYVKGFFNVRDFYTYRCENCNYTFNHSQNNCSGANGDW